MLSIGGKFIDNSILAENAERYLAAVAEFLDGVRGGRA